MGQVRDWFTDPDTGHIVMVTAIFTLATVGGGMLIGLYLATLLNRRLRGRGVGRTIVVAPFVLSGVAVGLLWLFVFDPNFGVTSALLKAFGAAAPDWYNDPQWALAMIIIVYLWKNVGYVALVYLAALQAVPKDLLEAATLDGATPPQAFRRIVLPLLGPTTFFLGVTTLLSSLQSFDIIQAMTKGGPLEGTTTMMYQIYQEGFQTGRAGYSSAIATVLPLVWMFLASFKDRDEIYTVPIQWLPASFDLSNYSAALAAVPFGHFFANSVITTVAGAGLKIMLGLPTAYAVVFLDFPFKKFIFSLVVFALLVPQQIVVIPNYTLVSELGWINTYQGMIVPGLASAFGTFLFRQHFLTLPVSILEAAALDGASHWTRLWRFVVPISGPTISAVALVSIVSEWNEYLWPLLVVDRADMMTLPVGLTLLQNNDGVTNWGVLMAGTVLVTLPMLVAFFILQRRIVDGLTTGAVTG
ncbi:ABC transporter permease subunit [Pseudarthrobacter sp. P1]|uniref:ABC transporter permease n=1 Tax=Pseudarthrobacter sp. P1 TaxID=3418418 RepID=UPI003CF03721